MATRNLTKAFVEIRNAERAARRRNAGTSDEEEAILKKVSRVDRSALSLHRFLILSY